MNKLVIYYLNGHRMLHVMSADGGPTVCSFICNIYKFVFANLVDGFMEFASEVKMKSKQMVKESMEMDVQ